MKTIMKWVERFFFTMEDAIDWTTTQVVQFGGEGGADDGNIADFLFRNFH